MFIIENITDIFLPIWTLWVRCAVWLIQANPIRSVWLILRVLSKKNCGKFNFFCGILNPTILAFRMYGATRINVVVKQVVFIFFFKLFYKLKKGELGWFWTIQIPDSGYQRQEKMIFLVNPPTHQHLLLHSYTIFICVSVHSYANESDPYGWRFCEISLDVVSSSVTL